MNLSRIAARKAGVRSACSGVCCAIDCKKGAKLADRMASALIR